VRTYLFPTTAHKKAYFDQNMYAPKCKKVAH